MNKTINLYDINRIVTNEYNSYYTHSSATTNNIYNEITYNTLK